VLTARVADLDGSLEVDCSRLRFIDAAGMRGLLEAHETCQARGDTLVFVDAPPSVLRLLQLVQLDTVLNLRQDGLEPKAEASGER
jgi:anti-anti-sigma factor